MLPCRGARRHLGLSGVHFRSQRRERNSAACTPQQARPARGVAPRRSTSTRLAGPALRASSGRQSSQRSKGRGPRRWWPTRLVQPTHTSRRCRSCSVAAHQVSEKLQPAPWRRNSSWPVSECAGWNRGPQARGVAPPERCQVGSATASQALRGELVQTPPPERDGAAVCGVVGLRRPALRIRMRGARKLATPQGRMKIRRFLSWLHGAPGIFLVVAWLRIHACEQVERGTISLVCLLSTQRTVYCVYNTVYCILINSNSSNNDRMTENQNARMTGGKQRSDASDASDARNQFSTCRQPLQPRCSTCDPDGRRHGVTAVTRGQYGDYR
jgi:hypothetical protein